MSAIYRTWAVNPGWCDGWDTQVVQASDDVSLRTGYGKRIEENGWSATTLTHRDRPSGPVMAPPVHGITTGAELAGRSVEGIPPNATPTGAPAAVSGAVVEYSYCLHS